MGHQGFTEHDAVATASGRWGLVEKTQYREIDLESGVFVPALQALVVALGVFGIVFVCLWQTIAPPKYAALAGAILGLASFTGVAVYVMYDARSSVLYSETWESESSNAGGAESARVIIEEINRSSDAGAGELAPGDSMTCKQINVDLKTLALVAHPETRLSKSGLMNLGINDRIAMNLLARLETLKYIEYETDNQPAHWTSRGLALCRWGTGFAGGGAGGGAAFAGGARDTTSGVGECMEVIDGS